MTFQILILHRGGGHQPQFVAHAIQGYHMPCQRRGFLNVVGGTGGLHTEHQLLCGSAAQCGFQVGDQLILSREELLLLGQVHGITQCTGSVRNDGDLGNRRGLFLQRSDQRVTDFMIGDQTLFCIGQDGVLLFGAGDDDLEGDQ